MRARWLALALAPLIPLAACGLNANDDDVTEAEAAALTTDTSNVEGAVQTMATDPLTMSEMASGEMSAAAAAKAAGQYLQPAGCFTATAALNKVTYTYNNCTGPYGLVKANGSVVVTFIPVGGGVKIDVASSGFKVNDATFNLAFTGTFTVAGATKTAMVNSTSSATSAKSKSITRAGTYTIKWDGTCLTIDGSFATMVGSTSYATTFSNLKACKTGCPTGSLTFASSKGAALTLTYDGSNKLKWSSGLKSGTIGLFCIPQ